MNTSSNSAEQVISIYIDALEMAARITGSAAKHVAIMLYSAMQNKKNAQPTRGKIKLDKLLKTEKELEIFSVKKKDLKVFCEQAKKYGILYCALINKQDKNPEGIVDILVRHDDAPKINRVIERFNLSIPNIASIENNIDKELVKVENEIKLHDENVDVKVLDNNTLSKNSNLKKLTNKSEKDNLSKNSLLIPEISETQIPTIKIRGENKKSVKEELKNIKDEVQSKIETKDKKEPIVDNKKKQYKNRKEL